MKKAAVLILVLVLAATGLTVLAQGTTETLTVPRTADLADPDHQQVTAELYPASAQGTGYVDELALDLHWPSSAFAGTDYQMILEPLQSDGQKAEYRYDGDIVEREYDENGEMSSERWMNKRAVGTAVFAQDASGRIILTFTDDMAKELNDLRLSVVDMPAPDREDVALSVLKPILELETGTAGSELKKAAAAARLIEYASLSRLYAVPEGALAQSMASALNSLGWTDEQYQTFTVNRQEILAFLNAYDDPYGEDVEANARVRALMEDAGVAERLAEVMTSGADMFSVKALTAQLAAI